MNDSSCLHSEDWPGYCIWEAITSPTPPSPIPCPLFSAALMMNTSLLETLVQHRARKQAAAGAGSAACLRARCCTDGILVTGGAGRRRMNDRILDFGHARIVILRDAALPIHLAIRSCDRVAVRLDPRSSGKVS